MEATNAGTRTLRYWGLLTCGALLIFAVGCGGGDDGGGNDPARLAQIVVSPGTVTIAAGGAQTFTASGRDQYGATFPLGGTVSWTATAAVGTITSTGATTARLQASTPAANVTGNVAATYGGLTGGASVVVTTGGSAGITALSRLATAADITVAGTGGISGTISSGGSPAAVTQVSLQSVSVGSTAEVRSEQTVAPNAAGQYGFVNVPAGRYRVTTSGGVTGRSEHQVAPGAIADGSQVITPSPTGTTPAEALTYLNNVRRTAGVSPVVLDAGLQDSVNNHAHYLILNMPLSHSPHTELPGNPGYTTDGLAAAEQSNIAIVWGGTRTVLEQTASLVNVPFHRVGHLTPNWQGTAIGYESDDTLNRSATVIDVGRNMRNTWRPGDEPVLYPAPNQVLVPTTYAGFESPDPLNGVVDSSVGFPITCQFPTGSDVRNASLFITPLEGLPLPTYITTPEYPAIEEPAVSYANFYTIVALPQEPLAVNTTYEVRINARYEGADFSQTYYFSTAATADTAAAKEGTQRFE